MSAIYHWLPGITEKDLVRDKRISPEILARFELTDVLRDVDQVPKHAIVANVRSGPGGESGVLIYPRPTHGDMPPCVAWHDDRFRVRDVQNSPRKLCWLPESPPLPTDLERTAMIPGYSVNDAYDRPWQVPVAVAEDNPRGNFEWAVDWDTAGQTQIGVIGRHADFWRDAGRLSDLIDRKGSANHYGHLILCHGTTAEEDQFLIDMAIRALAINYRLDRHVLGCLNESSPGFATQIFLSLVANAIVDMHGRKAWEAAAKKNAGPAAPAGVSSTPGEPAATPDSDPAEAS